jgi:hypothetical protein
MKGHHHVLVEYAPPLKQVRTVTDDCLFFAAAAADGRQCVCPFRLHPGERAVVLKIELLYSRNDWPDDPLELEVEAFFAPDADDRHRHPDHNGGRCALTLPAGWRGVLPKDRRLVYEPNMVNLGFSVVHYIGLEDSILNARSSCVTPQGVFEEHVLFRDGDPLLVFLLQNRQHFPELRSDDVRLCKADGFAGGRAIYAVRRHVVERVQSLFRNAIFPLIHYVQGDSLVVNARVPTAVGVAMCLLQTTYVVVSPQVPEYAVSTVKLDL